MKSVEKGRFLTKKIRGVKKEKMNKENQGLKEKTNDGAKSITLGFAIAAVLLVAAVGSASADGTITDCGQPVNNSGLWTIANDIINNTAPGTHCIEIQADNVILDGRGHYVDGVSPGACAFASQVKRSGIYANGRTNVTVEDVEVRNFCNGIYFENVDYSKISECCVHDNGNASATDGNKLNTNGIMLQNADHCNVSKNNIYNNTGKTQGGCGDGGSGIRLQGESDYNNITCNNITGNYLAGVFSKYWCQYNYIAYNYVHGNGHDVDPDPAWVGGGIRGECKNSNHWDIEYNNVTANYGPGIFMRGHGNDIRYNTMRDNVNATDNPAAVDPWAPEDWGAGTGIVSHRGTAGADNTVYNNSACNNEYYDIRDNNAHLNGDNNTCDTCSNYNDEGKICCSYDCPGEVGCVAVDGTVFGCGDTVTKSCTFNENISCAAGHGLIIVAGNITIDGNGYIIDGVSPGACDLWGGSDTE